MYIYIYIYIYIHTHTHTYISIYLSSIYLYLYLYLRTKMVLATINKKTDNKNTKTVAPTGNEMLTAMMIMTMIKTIIKKSY